jgi:hypothetical protein
MHIEQNSEGEGEALWRWCGVVAIVWYGLRGVVVYEVR